MPRTAASDRTPETQGTAGTPHAPDTHAPPRTPRRTTVDTPPGRRRTQLPAPVAFWVVGTAYALVMAFSTVPAPLYPTYTEVEGFGPVAITVIFAVYVLGVLAALLLLAHRSDVVGRRRFAVAALALAVASAALFTTSTSLPVLLVARVLSGLAVGILTATATAWLTELHLAARPDTDRTRAEVVATIANLGGLGAGPVIAGVVAAGSLAPLLRPYQVMLVALALIGIVVWRGPETVARPVPTPPWRPRRPTLPPRERRRFLASAAAAAVGFAVLGYFTSLAPAAIAVIRPAGGPALAGALVTAMFVASVAAQLAARRLDAPRQTAVGLLGLAAGGALVGLGPALDSLALLTAGGVLGGAGTGLAFRGAIGTGLTLTEPARRGGTMATVFVIAYLGLTVPILGLGAATAWVGAVTAVLGFGTMIVLATAVIAWTLRRTVTPSG